MGRVPTGASRFPGGGAGESGVPSQTTGSVTLDRGQSVTAREARAANRKTIRGGQFARCNPAVR